MKKYFFILSSFLFLGTANAQMMGGARFNVGHFYGKVIDSATNKSVPFAAIQLSAMKWDSVSRTMKNTVVTGQLTGDNGEFSFTKLSVIGKYTLDISAIGYAPYEQKVSFHLNKLRGKKVSAPSGDDPSSPSATSDMSSLINAVDIDLGNIHISPSVNKLKTVTVSGEAPVMELKLDKKVFDVSKSLTTEGGTAEDVLRNVPSVNVDIDGNVTLRNSSPTIYVDGMPTTLTIDQIPADQIDKVEVITNPSAKYDASAGSGGIINIIMKKNRVMGYNGNVKAGVDERGKLNLGLNLNVRQGKINVFGSLNYHKIDHIIDGTTTRDNLELTPLTDIVQKDVNTMNGDFAFARFGVDYFINNRNTLTVSGVIGRGNFNVGDNLNTTTDTLHNNSPTTSSFTNRISNTTRTFDHNSANVAYKYLFPKEDETFSANAQIEQGTSTGNGIFNTQNFYSDETTPLGSQVLQQQLISGLNNELIAQADYSDPLAHKITISTGVEATLTSGNSITNNYLYNSGTSQYEELASQGSNYNFNQQIYAGYFILSQEIGTKFSYQAGLRAESSAYSGQFVDSTNSYSNKYPISLFPSAYMTYHLTSNSDLQLNYSRHIIRPSFFQLVPIINYSDSLNLTEGNPDLKPQFINTYELNYLKTINKNNSYMFSVYDKYSTNLITSYQNEEFNSFLDEDVIINTYENANSSNSYGFEATSQNSLKTWLDVTTNINVYESEINAQNLSANLTNQQLSWFAKLNLTFKLPGNLSLQLMGNYLSKSIIPANQGGRWGGPPPATVQGYILPNYWMDAAIKKDFLKNKAASVTLNVKDIFATAVTATTSNTPAFDQTTSRVRDPQFFRLTFSYRFGQTDFSLFKRKDTNIQAPTMDTGGMDTQ